MNHQPLVVRVVWLVLVVKLELSMSCDSDYLTKSLQGRFQTSFYQIFEQKAEK